LACIFTPTAEVPDGQSVGFLWAGLFDISAQLLFGAFRILMPVFRNCQQPAGDYSYGQRTKQHQCPGHGKSPQQKLEFDDLCVLYDKNEHDGYKNDK
jgi:hypothetical protein